MWQIIVGIYDGDPRLTNDHKSSWRVGKARKVLGRVGNTRKVFREVCPQVTSVGICIQSQGQLISVCTCAQAQIYFLKEFSHIFWRLDPLSGHQTGQSQCKIAFLDRKWSKTRIFSPDMPQQILANSDLHLPSTIRGPPFPNASLWSRVTSMHIWRF